LPTVPASAGPQATVVVVTYNGAHLLPPCLDALADQTLPRTAFGVVVVDNGSSDGTAELVGTEYPWVELVRSDRNLGFPGGNNLALRRATTPLAVLINNDARPAPEFLERIVEVFDRPDAARVAAVTAKVLFDRPSVAGEGAVLNSTGNLVARDGCGFDRDFGRPEATTHAVREVFGFCGCAAALRMDALRQVGFFDDSLFLYFEDTDLSWRLRAAGWDVWYESGAVARHLFAASSTTASPLSVYHQSRNMLLVFTRHAPRAIALWVVVRFVLALPVRAVKEFRSPRLTGARLRALGGYLRRLPQALRDRRDIWRTAAVPRAEVARFIEPSHPRLR
jgi:GT2 family glycosyltransferase